MMPSWPRRLRTPFLALLALNALVFLVYTLPRRIQQTSAAARAVVLKAEVDRQRSRTDAVRRRADTITHNAADVRRFYERLGSKASLLDVREEIEARSRELGLRLGERAYRNEAVKGASSLGRFEMAMAVSGTYPQLASLLERLEAASHFVIVDEIALRKRAETGGPEATLDVVLSAYFRQEPQS